jgi:hypothetical protein
MTADAALLAGSTTLSRPELGEVMRDPLASPPGRDPHTMSSWGPTTRSLRISRVLVQQITVGESHPG